MRHKLLRKMRFLGLIFFVIVMVAAIMAFAATRKVTLTTYYPAPYGKYNDLQSKTLTVSDRVGIGTTNPTIGRFEVQGSLSNPTASAIATHVPLYGSGGIAAYLGGNKGIALVANYIEDITFGLVDTDGNWSSTFKEYMRIAGSSGNVGIGGFGNTAVEAKLDVRYAAGDVLPKGLVYFSNSGVNALTTLTLGDSGYTGTRYLLKAVADTDADAGGPYDVFAIRSDGNVGIGTANPQNRLHISGSGVGYGEADDPVIRVNVNNTVRQTALRFTANDDMGSRWEIGRSGSSQDAGNFYLLSGNYTRVLTATPSGTITGAYGMINGPSDVRFKKSIVTIRNALEKVLNLRGVNFRWKDTNNDQDLHMGMIAQEVEKVVPEVVHTSDDEMKTKAVEYQYLTALLIEAVKEQQKKIEELQAKLAGMEAKM